MTLHTTIKAAAVAAAFSFAATAASAETVSLEFVGTASPPGGVQIDVTNFVNASVPTIAGAFNVKVGIDNFLAWCVDLDGVVSPNTTYSYNKNANFLSAGGDYAPNTLDRLQAVFDANYVGNTLLDSTKSAAFQVAIWDAIYDTDWNAGTAGVSSGFKVLSSDSDSLAVIAQANTYLAAAKACYDDPNCAQKWVITQWEANNDTGPRAQDLVSVNVIPVPAGALLILSAVGVAAGVRRYGRSKA